MSSSTSYRWALQQEQERQRRIAALAELEAQRVREKALQDQRRRAELEAQRVRERELQQQRQRAALRVEIEDLLEQEQSLHADATDFHVAISIPELSRPTDALIIDDLEVFVLKAREALDNVEDQLLIGMRRRAADGLADQMLSREPDRRVPHGGAKDPDDEDAEEIARLATAAVELLHTQGSRCAVEDLADLQHRCDAIGHLGPAAARVALRDLDVRLSESVGRQKRREAAAQLRARLRFLADYAYGEERAGLIQAIRDAPDPKLAAMQSAVEAAVARESSRRARTEVTKKVLDVLGHSQYAVGEQFVDVLNRGGEVMLASPHHADYGLRLKVDLESNEMYAAAVRRDDASPGVDRDVQLQTCADLDTATQRLVAEGWALEVNRLDPDGNAPPMSSALWPERERSDAEQDGMSHRPHTERLRVKQAKSKDSS